MVIHKNIIANYMAAGMMVAAPLLALPWYLNILEPQQFGLISFVSTLQAFLALLDSGIGQVSMREFSIRMSGASSNRQGAATLLISFERVYFGIALMACLLTLLSSPIIAAHWLVLEQNASDMALQAVWGAAFIFLFQFPGTLYRSFLIGSQEQVPLNAIIISSLLLRHVGGVVLLMAWPALSVYLMWQIVITLLETSVRAIFSWRVVGVARGEVGWDSVMLKPIWPAVAKMSGAVVLGSLATQMDKIVLSKMLPIDQFGYYVIAATLSQGVLQLITPLMQAASPIIMQLHASQIELRALNIRLIRSIGAIVLVSGLVYAVAGEWFLQLWLRDMNVTTVVYPVLSILLVGSALNAFYHIGFFNWLAHKKSGRILTVNVLSLLICVLVIPPMVSSYGLIGATAGFVAMNAFGLLISLEYWLPVGRKK